MSAEKSPALLIPENPYEEEKRKHRYCSRNLIIWILAALLAALGVALCVEFLYPIFVKRYKLTDVNVVHVYDEEPVEVHIKVRPSTEDAITDATTDEPWHLDFLINPTRLCDTQKPPYSEAYRKDPEVKLLILVHSATDHFAERQTIRKTWGSNADKPQSPTRLGFILGTTSNATENDMISNESETYGDIIQANFNDTDGNQTIKSVLMLKWVSKHCPHAQYFLKADDDTFVNLSTLTKLLEQQLFSPEEKFIGGFVHRGVQPSRDPNEKYYISEIEYPEVEFPPYISGSTYITSGSTATKLFEAAQEVKPLLPMDDIFITGVCANKIAANLVHEPSFRNEDLTRPFNWDGLSSLATIHGVSTDDMDQLWNGMAKSLSDAFDFDDKIYSDSLNVLENKPLSAVFDQWIRQSGNLMNDENSWLESKSSSWEFPDIKIDSLNWKPNVKADVEVFGWLGNPVNPNTQKHVKIGAENLPLHQMNNAPFKIQENQLPAKWPETMMIPFPLQRTASSRLNISQLLRF